MSRPISTPGRRYMLAWTHVLMPIAWEFNPDLVLISAGFDAAIGDPLVGSIHA